ncbi:Acetyl esterase/lipase [Draconibacterium orientale]|uniref:1,4-beta-xylanase n=1 Tax=Draconibacterium orientale TaxID=1168034 RepID=X5DIC8_9BACT|nr:alpha/beta hydrolase [Draconibacterium orientale]AHW60854.1 1,4-beta-xylanase [Draconibacterium orientale]SES66813.1 Acetyl esterase/lipase [Draconibacterium orientale]
MKTINLILLFSLLTGITIAQNKTLKVWPNGAPNDNGVTEPEEKYDGVRVRNVSEAEMYVYTPAAEINSGAAVVICPGGGYWIEAMDHEGFDIARFLQGKGITGIVLKYRLPYGNHEVPSSDVRQAIRMVRANAKEWGINPEKIGIAGSSAGGHLASTAGTVFDYGNAESADKIEQQSCRPDFMLLLYPVITMDETFTHMGSRENLIGKGHDKELIRKYSNELNVSAETPPTFLVLADDDTAVLPKNSISFYSKLKEFDVPAELHIFQKGGHGFGIRENGIPADNWPNLFIDWLKAREIIE